MSLKQILAAVGVMIVLVLGGYFAVTGLGGGDSAPAVVVGSPGKILPLGNKLDTTTIKKYNADSKLFNYPKVNPSEIGPSLGDIAKAVQ